MLEKAIRQLEKFRRTDPAGRTIDFGTKTSGWSWGSAWRIHVQPSGSGCVAVATIVSAGSAVAETSEGKKIRRIFDVAETLLPKQTTPAASGLFGSSPLEAPDLVPKVHPDLPDKHRHLVHPILQAIAEAEAAAAAGDVVAEELALNRATRTAASAGMLAIRPAAWCEQEIHARTVAGRLRKNVELLGKVGANLVIMSDRVTQGEKVQAMDARVTASVEVGGTIVQSTRPTLTRMAMGSVLPGSALLVGLAVPKTKTRDLRTASFILAHPEWRLIELIDPDGAHEVSGVAAQVNANATLQRDQAAVPPQQQPTSMADELQKLASLRDAGVLTDVEFAAAKARLIG
ncbi:SHOCT domain-containing protein [Nocardioides carbamazepini]|uniref:SHOCT domain-containing protein n=1 Tax=Nocardioides carbamazepini TaxID=2854259 RepID=UPI002149C835|nr:SHOCT domain-containing protein [Nocardioides carbamazepini]MCR1781217.1 SHOCT domain-containing protein [Nocardioides carbamazepini]